MDKKQRRKNREDKKRKRAMSRIGKQPDLEPYIILLKAPEHVAMPQAFKLIHENKKHFKKNHSITLS